MKTEEKLAKRILEVIPPSMARIREELRASCASDVELSVPQAACDGLRASRD